MPLIKTAAGREFFASPENAIRDLVNHAVAFGGAVLVWGGQEILTCSLGGELNNIED